MDLKEIIRLLENFSLDVIAAADDADLFKQQIIDHLKSVPVVRKRKCPGCGSPAVIMFDSDNDYCRDCESTFPGTL